MGKSKKPTAYNALSLSALVVDAMDPRITVQQRNRLCRKMIKFDSFTALVVIAGLASGMLHSFAEALDEAALDEETQGDDFLDKYLSEILQVFGNADLPDFKKWS